MKISKLLNKKSGIYLILFFLISFNANSQDEPVDIWNIDKSQNDVSQENLESNNEIVEQEEQITEQQILSTDSLKIESEILEEQELKSNKIKIIGLYDPAENGLTMQMWRNSNGKELKEIFASLDKINLS